MTQQPSNEILAAIAAAYTVAFASGESGRAPERSRWALAARTFADAAPRVAAGSRWADAGRRHD